MQHVPLGELFWEVEVNTQGAQQQCCQWGRWRCDPLSSLLPAPSLPPSATFQAEERWERSRDPALAPVQEEQQEFSQQCLFAPQNQWRG